MYFVKGFDFKLLKCIREGEDVYGESKMESEVFEEFLEEVDDEFDKFEM